MPSLETVGDRATLGFHVVASEVEATEQIYDLSIALGCNLMRSLCGTDWVPTEVLLPRRRPSDPGPWQRVFRARVTFEAGRAALVFPLRWLARPVPAADPMLHRLLERQALDQRGELATDFAAEVRRIVRAAIALEDVGAALGYADASTFIRAFARWSGRTPEQWRREGDARTPTNGRRPRSSGR